MTRPRSAATLTDSVVREPSCAVVREQPPSREASFKTQGKWVSMQQTALRHRRQRCAHLLSLLERELADDEKREIVLYGFADADPQRKKHIAQHYKMRAEGADRVMRVLEARCPPVVARTRVRHGRSVVRSRGPPFGGDAAIAMMLFSVSSSRATIASSGAVGESSISKASNENGGADE